VARLSARSLVVSLTTVQSRPDSALPTTNVTRVGYLAGTDKILFLDMDRNRVGMSSADAADVACLLRQLDAPGYVVEMIEQTQAFDGRHAFQWARCGVGLPPVHA
jgi:hypothetical protein